jgi:glycosyltransferase involved in cell wall biosynthesis
MPAVSVIMPVYNAEQYLSDSIKSILSQTFEDYEFIIIDDGSTDSSVKIIQSFKDARISFLQNEKNLGITATLNKALGISRGEYICRMDADDIALNNRLEKQIEFIRAHKSISIIGTQATLIDEKGQIIGEEIVPETSKDINRMKFIHNPFIHGSVLWRSSLIERFGIYDSRRRHTEDYDLWLRYTKQEEGFNLKDKLIFRRIHSESITVSKELELVWNRFLTIAHAIIFYYRNPFLFVYLVRPFFAYIYRKYFC